MRRRARVLPGARCFRGAAAVLGGAAAVCATFRRRSRSARFAAVPPPGRLDVPNYSGAGLLPRLFFLTAARKTEARRGGFCRRARLYYHLRI